MIEQAGQKPQRTDRLADLEDVEDDAVPRRVRQCPSWVLRASLNLDVAARAMSR